MDTNLNNKQWLNSLRAIAMLGVIIIHVSSPLVNMTFGKNMPYWWIGNFVDSAVRFAVPIFLMLSGATLLEKEYKLKEFYKRRFLRVLVPFLFWMIVYWVYRWLVLLPKLQPQDLHSILKWAVHLFLKEGISKHFWYIYMIVFIYLFVPFLGNGIRKLRNPTILYLLIGWGFLTFASQTIPLNMYNWSGDYLSKIFGYLLFTGYLILGYYLSKLTVVSKRIRYVALSVFILTILVSAVSTYILSINAHKIDLKMYGYLNINAIVQSITLFMWVKDGEIKNRYLLMFQDTISNYSYGIYLVHILVLGVFFNNGIFWTMAHPLISLPLLIVLTLATSYVIIYILRKIPFGNYISG